MLVYMMSGSHMGDVIIWSNDSLGYWRIYAFLSLNDLKNSHGTDWKKNWLLLAQGIPQFSVLLGHPGRILCSCPNYSRTPL